MIIALFVGADEEVIVLSDNGVATILLFPKIPYNITQKDKNTIVINKSMLVVEIGSGKLNV